MKTLVLVILCFATFLLAQEKNKTTVDEKSNYPILIGICDKTAFSDTSFSWWFNFEYNNYLPDSIIVEQLKGIEQDYRITLVIGTWCSDSKREIPRFYKILDMINYDQNKITLICVDRSKVSSVDGYSELGIKFVPTIIFYRNGSEIGRIIEAPVGKLEKDILEIIRKEK